MIREIFLQQNATTRRHVLPSGAAVQTHQRDQEVFRPRRRREARRAYERRRLAEIPRVLTRVKYEAEFDKELQRLSPRWTEFRNWAS